jgi:hypothetical protein
MKPTYHITHARLYDSFWGSRKILMGTNVDNPNCTIGGSIITSDVVNHDENCVETRNSVYVVDSWADVPDPADNIG